MKDKLHHKFFCTLSVLSTAYRLSGHPFQERTRMHDVKNVVLSIHSRRTLTT